MAAAMGGEVAGFSAQDSRRAGQAGPSGTSDASAALRFLMPRLHDLGITRIADLTGLDRIGIPVAQAVRPLGLANAVTQGKGVTLAAAATSSIMEAAEQFFAERIDRIDVVGGCALDFGHEVKTLANHVRSDAPENWASMETAWVEATDHMAGGKGWLPLELVHTAYVEPGLPTDGIFSTSSNGLACAFCERRALSHALLERVERDAIAKAERTHGFFQRFRINLEQAEDDVLDTLVERVRSAGLQAAFWLAPTELEIPVVWCQIMEDGSQPPITPYPADGFAADLDFASAARKALLEAAQSRLAAISGARDDITRHLFRRNVDWAAVNAHRALLAEGPRPINWRMLRESGGGQQEDQWDELVARLAARSTGPVLAYRYDTQPLQEIVAVRVFVPWLLPLSEM